jgi:tetratricopeptide (TPR) repeat protein
MNVRLLIVSGVLLLQSVYGLCQSPPQEFINGLQLFITNKPEAKREFLIAINKEPAYFGSYHFLGVVYLGEHKPDSAICCFKQSIVLNTGNVNHTREIAYVRLSYAYYNQLDFQDAFTTTLEAYKLYPDNQSLKSNLRDICLWAYYIHHNGLNPAYLSSDPKDEYVVNGIDEEYLILRNLRVNDENVNLNRQNLVNQNNASYDVFNCVLSISKKPLTINFRLNWDLSKYFGGLQGPAQHVIDDNKNPIYERAGAMLVSDIKSDVKVVIESLHDN